MRNITSAMMYRLIFTTGTGEIIAASVKEELPVLGEKLLNYDLSKLGPFQTLVPLINAVDGTPALDENDEPTFMCVDYTGEVKGTLDLRVSLRKEGDGNTIKLNVVSGSPDLNVTFVHYEVDFTYDDPMC